MAAHADWAGKLIGPATHSLFYCACCWPRQRRCEHFCFTCLNKISAQLLHQARHRPLPCTASGATRAFPCTCTYPQAPSPPPPTTFGAKAGGPSELSPTEAIKAGTEWLAAWISANYVGMGKSAADALPELRRRGVVCTYVKDGHHLFRFPGEPTQVDAPRVAKMLQLRPR
mmetsp:Transcript_21484/g.56000  ORF Transcript_21484/g.56000 Transcript_21484/m.56000 type:complete len:171 (+) Transcript_21484:189-701(+)